jgi:hypothetical protein
MVRGGEGRMIMIIIYEGYSNNIIIFLFLIIVHDE